jgi:tellurite resistance-related uncharacterized protein
MTRLPDKKRSLGRSPEFDRASVPAALLERHALAEGRWARLTVHAGELVFVDLDGGGRTSVSAGENAVVPPLLPHRVEPSDDARFELEFFEET